MLGADDGGPLPPRRSVDERAAQRERMQQAGRDRYSSLLRILQAGQELPWQQRAKGRRVAWLAAWHPIAGKLLRAAVIAIVGYLAITTALNIWRDSRVDVWSGPDGSVSSGQVMADCPLVGSVRDNIFPNWLRFDGKVYRLTDTIRPMGFEPDADFPPTGYRLEQMALYRVINTPDGQEGRIVLIKLDTSAVGRVYRLTPDCT